MYDILQRSKQLTKFCYATTNFGRLAAFSEIFVQKDMLCQTQHLNVVQISVST